MIAVKTDSMPKISIPKGLGSPLRGLSLQHRIPALISLLLLFVISLFVLISYWRIRKIETSSGKEKLQAVVAKMSNMLSESIDEFVLSSREAAGSVEFSQFLANRNTLSAFNAHKKLKRYAGGNPHENAIVVDTKFQPVLDAQASETQPAAITSSFVPIIKDTSHKACNIYARGDTIYYAALSKISVDGVTLGYLIRSRMVKPNTALLVQYSGLADQGVSMLVGNDDGSLWTDLSTPINYIMPSEIKINGSVYQYKSADEKKLVGTAYKVRDTPWLIVIEAPYSLAVQGSLLYLKWMVTIAVFLILLGAGLAWYFGRKLAIPLLELIKSVEALGTGAEVPVTIHRTDEVGSLAQSFNKMIAQIRSTNMIVQKQMDESASLNKGLRRLSAHLQTVREEERVGIARELHDQLGQVLTGFKMDLHFLKKNMKSSRYDLMDEKMSSLESAVDEGMRFVRKLSSELRGGPLEDLGLVAALQWHAKNFSERFKIELNIEAPSEITLPLKISTAIFRIFQEALTNVARHANASKVNVKVFEDKERLIVIIADNGRGFDSSQKSKKTLGLIGMHERALMIGAELLVHSQPGQGCEIKLIADYQFVREVFPVVPILPN